MTALEIVQQYYNAFNREDWEGMLTLVHPNVRHEPNQSEEPRIGLVKFTQFLQHMDASYEEELTDMVFFTEDKGNRVAVEFVVNGVYKKAEAGLPPARNQQYQLPAAAFLEVKEGKIFRITTYYNLTLWIKLVSS
ncbi:nuclear transport factor 2 family protein [Nafulsella turpanensis]|uniref:nuclear transport factor 2 family protein n=1 Tax=Nafulsella turpanensis TaxID=1265690 RepID=UPI00034AB4C3|nr:nuclear transport factor 2 family protein [Nafulsella turpanensis]